MLGVWLLAWGGFALARNSKVTAEKVRAYLRATDLSQLSGAARARALHRLAAQLNALTIEERRQARLDREWARWFAQMTDAEKGEFLDATMPTGFKQMLTAFEQLPPDKRRRSIQDSLRRLQEAPPAAKPDDSAAAGDTNAPPQYSEELQKKITTIGLNAFYTESSAQTKAEMAPLLEELQRSMESGRLFRQGRRREGE